MKTKPKKRTKKKLHKTSDPTWYTHTYGSDKTPFNMEWLKFYNPMEGRDQILFIYSDKLTGKICKWRTLN